MFADEINSRIPRSHELAVSKGWWPANVEDRDTVEIINNFHAEVSQAWEEWCAGRLGLWLSRPGRAVTQVMVQNCQCDGVDGWSVTECHPDGTVFAEYWVEEIPATWKPNGFWVELADLCIRVMDAMGAYGVEMSDTLNFVFDTHGKLVKRLHVEIANGGLCDKSLRELISRCFQAARDNRVDLLELIDIKHRYNETLNQ